MSKRKTPNRVASSAGLAGLDPTFVSYDMRLRFGMVDAIKRRKTPPSEACEMLNMLEACIEGEMTPEQIVDGFMEGTLPKRYKPSPAND